MPSSSTSFFPIPTAGTTEGTANFTIPVDEFAFIQMSVASSVGFGLRSSSGNGGGGGVADGKSGNMWLDDGDTVATATSAPGLSTTTDNTIILAIATADVLINATIVIRAQCTAKQGTGTSNGASIDSTADARYGISRFDK